MKRLSMGATKEENYEHVLMCLICRSLFDDNDHQPKFLPCHHTFCKDCLREYVRQIGEDIECPSCRKVATVPTAGVTALQTNFYVKYIHNLVQGVYVGDGTSIECTKHPGRQLKYFCHQCASSICDECDCQSHQRQQLTSATEEYHQKLDTGFAESHALIERKNVELEGMMKALSKEKDEALLKIDSSFEDYAHTLSRRTTLLKNKVIAIYNEHVESLETDMEEVSTAMTCIVSLKEFYETFLARGQLAEIERGLLEMEEVHQNIQDKVLPKENHIMYQDKHGAEKFKCCAKDLGRVYCSRPNIPRTDPEGNDAMTNQSPTTTSGSNTGVSPTSTSDPVLDSASERNRLGATSAAESRKVRDPMTTSFHAQLGTPFGGDQLRSGTDSVTDAHFASSAGAEGGRVVSSNLEKPVMVVRPKTLQTSSSKQSKTNAAVVKQLPSSKQKLSSATIKAPQHPKEEILKQTDKMYHHLVYTSYDEEELLKELQAGKVQMDETARESGARKMEDSWTTVSSDGDSTLSGNSDELCSPRDVSQL